VPDNTQQSEERNIYDAGEIRTRNPQQASGYWDRRSTIIQLGKYAAVVTRNIKKWRQCESFIYDQTVRNDSPAIE
jgi:hypothetical protein